MSLATKKVRIRVYWPLVAALAIATGLTAGGSSQKFYADDPIARVVDSQDASRVEEEAGQYLRRPAHPKKPQVRAPVHVAPCAPLPDIAHHTRERGRASASGLFCRRMLQRG